MVHRAALRMLALVPALLLAACVTPGTQRPDAGEWRFVKRGDPVTGSVTTARLYLSKYNFGSGLIDYVELELMCFKSAPVVKLRFPRKVGSNRSAAFAYRFDGKPARESEARILQDYRTILIEEHDEVAAFIKELASARMLSLSVSSLLVGHSWARFVVQGAPKAIEAAYAECPLNGKTKQA